MSKFLAVMASPPFPCVDIFDDFDDAEAMDSAYCSQVSEAQFQEDIRSETDKALGELCLYLDQNPDVYARVLRKRKQEEIESQGVVSYVKSKMMSVLHGEQYPQCLVSPSDCMQQTSALKAGMCKTFQYSQKLKGNATRHSKRLAARRQHGKYPKNSTKDDQNSVSASAFPVVAANKENGNKLDSQTTGTGNLKSSSSSNMSSTSQENHSSILTSSDADIGSAQESRMPNKQSNDKITDKQATANSKTNSGNAQTEEKDLSPTNTALVLQEAEVQSNNPESFPPVPPPPPPPLPPHLINSVLPSKPLQKASGVPKTPRLSVALASITNTATVQIDGKTPVVVMEDVSKSPCRKSRRSSPRLVPASIENSLTRSRSEKNLLSSSRPESRSSMDGVFLTPVVTKRMKFHKRSHSNSSMGSASSYESIQSELVSSNPLTRLKTTQIARSPGGTPVRTKPNDRLPSEPLHKALVTAMRSKFKNVKTPSPRSVNGSLNASNTSAFNSTFSP